MHRRKTCLRCEQEGRTTELIPFKHWGICPVHEPHMFQPAPKRAKPELADRGGPRERTGDAW